MRNSIYLCLLVLWACGQEKPKETAINTTKTRTNNDNISQKRVPVGFGPDKLSDFGFFVGNISDLNPANHVVSYELNTPLFSDYAGKLRFIAFPAGAAATYDAKETFDFPLGTVLIKNFYYPNDASDLSQGRKLIETRLLRLEEVGWNALTYIWNDEQTEAFLEWTGGTVDISYTHTDGVVKNVAYAIPSLNQCKNCHAFKNSLRPIGTNARQLNRDNNYEGAAHNQLAYLASNGYLKDLPAFASIPRLAQWDDPSAPLTDRARAYLDINCGSCHRPEGTANTSGLFLHEHQEMGTRYGLRKTPVAAGKGSGGHSFDIMPGQPDQSILLYRMQSTDPGVMMPEIGRKLVHEEGVELIAAWIKSL